MFDLVSDQQDLASEALDGLFRQVTTGGYTIDALGQNVEAIYDLGCRLFDGDLLYLVGEGRDAHLDALERFIVKMRRLSGDGCSDDGTRELVEAFVDQAKHIVAAATTLTQ